jgi:hypothetical protein
MKRSHNKHKIEAVQRHKRESFSKSMARALSIAQKRAVTHTPLAHCVSCSSELVRAKQGQRELLLCLKCGFDYEHMSKTGSALNGKITQTEEI